MMNFTRNICDVHCHFVLCSSFFCIVLRKSFDFLLFAKIVIFIMMAVYIKFNVLYCVCFF